MTLQPSSVATRSRLSRLQSTSASWSGFGSPNKPDPVWVDTHKGVPVLIAESKPTNPCKVCLGRGKVVCGTCDGKGTSQVCTAASLSAAATSMITMSAPCQQLNCHTKCCFCCCNQCRHLQCGSVHVAKKAAEHLMSQAEQTGYSTECCQVGCGPNGVQAAEAAACGTAKGKKMHCCTVWICKQGGTDPAHCCSCQLWRLTDESCKQLE